MKRILATLTASTLTLIPALSFSAPYYGFTYSNALVDKNPPHLGGFQTMVSYDPQRFQWRKFNLLFDGGFSRFWVNTPQYNALNIYSIAPIIRYTFKQRGPFHPFVDLSIGASWMTKTRMSNKNYGIHFAFQDRVGIGTFLGASEQFSFGFHVLHYSNAHLSSHNSGITVPVVLDIGYRFH